LGQSYPNAKCELNFKNPLQLLVATILSAQCTDARVNLVTKELFKRYKTTRDFADADLAELERAVRPTGFFRNKAKNIKKACQGLVAEYHGKVPPSMEALVQLPGVARKTANVILSTAFDIPSGIVVDTHVYRVAHRLGLSQQKDPNKVEQDLMKIVPRDQWIAFSHQAVLHGRYTCLARRPKCEQCLLYDLCESEDKVA
jgi:endonuclease-3